MKSEWRKYKWSIIIVEKFLIVEVTDLMNDNGNMKVEGNEQESRAIKIRSIQAASLYRVNNNYKFVVKLKNDDGSYSGEKRYKEPFLDFESAVINSSLFAEYVRKHGVVVNKYHRSLDFIILKFV